MPAIHPFGLIGAIFVFVGCSTAPDPVLYTLADQPQLDRSERSQSIIGLSEVVLPAYARNQQITTAISKHRISEDDDHRWAAPPSEAITSSLATVIENHSSDSVVRRPYPSGINPDARIHVEFDRILRGLNGEAELIGRYIITGQDTGPVVQTFNIVVPEAGTGYERYMSALSLGIGMLGERIADDLPD